ncbi:MAG: apolipoprotein N-acyltransferase, partial [Pseudomonadota bacterium]|nr:apolipoprotein N-acyltransferase [Pseudomonadota bacterium]
MSASISSVRRQVARFPVLLALALGAVSATGFAPLDWWPVALACLAGWIALIHAAPTRRSALLRGWMFGVGHFAIGNNWIQHAFTYQDAMPHWLGYLAVILLACYLAVYPMLAGALAWRFRRGTLDTGFVLIAGAGWIVTEYLRAELFSGYAWNPLGVIWLPTGLAAIAAWCGTYALSGLTILVAGGIALMFARRGWRLLAGTLAVLAIGWIGNLQIERTPPTTAPDKPHLIVVQPDIGEEARRTSRYDDYIMGKFEQLSALSGKPDPAHQRLIFWPEGGVENAIEDGYPPNYDWPLPATTLRRLAARLLGPRDVLLTGGQGLRFDGGGDLDAATNSIFAIDARARIIGRYDKAHLVPYGEYLPARPILSAIGLSRLVPGDVDYLPGPGPRNLSIPGIGAIGGQICYEIVFSGEVVDRAHRPAFLFNPSNDAWFGEWGPPEHLAQARLRAIEEGLPIVRSTPNGISAVIGADGALIATIARHRA